MSTAQNPKDSGSPLHGDSRTLRLVCSDCGQSWDADFPHGHGEPIPVLSDGYPGGFPTDGLVEAYYRKGPPHADQ